MDVFKQLMAARVMEATSRIVQENMTAAEGSVPQQAIATIFDL